MEGAERVWKEIRPIRRLLQELGQDKGLNTVGLKKRGGGWGWGKGISQKTDLQKTFAGSFIFGSKKNSYVLILLL